MSVRNHSNSSIARTSGKCIGEAQGKEHHSAHKFPGGGWAPSYHNSRLEAQFNMNAYHPTSGYPFHHLNQHPTASTAAGADEYFKYMSPMEGGFDPAGKVMENTIGFNPDFKPSNYPEVVSHGLLELVRIGFNMLIAKKILDAAVFYGVKLFLPTGTVDMQQLRQLVAKMTATGRT